MNIKQTNIINQYDMSIGEIDCMDQNISAYMIYLRTKKWPWPFFRFAVAVAVTNVYQIHCQFHLNPVKYRLNALGSHLAILSAYYCLNRNCWRVLYLYRKSLPSAALFTGSRRLHYPGNKPRYIITKNEMLVFMPNITVSRASRRGYLR